MNEPAYNPSQGGLQPSELLKTLLCSVDRASKELELSRAVIAYLRGVAYPQHSSCLPACDSVERLLEVASVSLKVSKSTLAILSIDTTTQESEST